MHGAEPAKHFSNHTLKLMRISIVFFLVILGITCNTAKSSKTNRHQLDGTWFPTMQEMAGKKLPDAMLANQKLVIADSNYTVFAESADKGRLTYSGGKMDITGTEG